MGKPSLPSNLCEFWHPGTPDNLGASLQPASTDAIPDISSLDLSTVPRPAYSLSSQHASSSPSSSSASSTASSASFRDLELDLRFESVLARKVNRGCFVVGRKRKHADIAIEHGSISRAHSLIFYDVKCGLYVQDCGSKNGTFVNNARLGPNIPVPLKPGAILRFGNYPFCLRIKIIEIPKITAIHAKSQNQDLQTASRGSGGRLGLGLTVGRDADRNVMKDLPIMEHETFAKVHTKAVCALAVNSSGSRFATGSYDYTVRLWDFGGMTSQKKPFREMLPEDGHIVSSLSFSPTGALFLATPESAKARVFTREGKEELVTTRGDPYLHDQLRTKGHVSTVTCGQWSPVEKQIFLTSAVDGTCRLWDVKGRRTLMDKELICTRVLKAKDKRNARIKVTACTFSHDGQRIACTCTDGSVQLWNPTSGAQYGNPDITIRPAHAPGTDTSSVAFGPRGASSYLLSRGGDDSLLLWDIRKAKGPVKQMLHVTALDNTWPQCNAVFSPNGDYILTGTSTKRGGPGTGDLCFWKVADASSRPLHRVPVCSGASVIGVNWHAKLNQIFVTGEEGLVRIYYDPDRSTKGILQALGRSTTRKRDYFANVDPAHVHEGDIYVPNALPMFRDAQENMFIRKKYKQTVQDQKRKDPVLSKRPELPPAQIQANINQEINQMNVASAYNEGVTRPKAHVLQQDPRAELLKYDVSGKSDGQATWVEGSYKESQPTKLLAEKTMEEDEEMILKARTSLKEYQEQSAKEG